MGEGPGCGYGLGGAAPPVSHGLAGILRWRFAVSSARISGVLSELHFI
jgi:hypothetical protein